MTRGDFHKLLEKEFNESCCYQQLLMKFNLYGYDLTDEDNVFILRKLFKDIEYHIEVERYMSGCPSDKEDNTEYINKCAQFINEMITETDIITENNIIVFAPFVCRMILDSKRKNILIPAFKFMCDHFGPVMIREYNNQKSYRQYGV